MKRYVVFHEDTTDKKGTFEVYAHWNQSWLGTIVEVTDKLEDAKTFASARAAYEWAAAKAMHWWRVGAR